MAGDPRRGPGSTSSASSLGASDDPATGPSRRIVRATQVVGALVAAVLLLAPTAAAFTTRATAVDETGDRGAAEWLDAVLKESSRMR